jgi:hypothetical protein
MWIVQRQRLTLESRDTVTEFDWDMVNMRMRDFPSADLTDDDMEGGFKYFDDIDEYIINNVALG